MSSSGSDSEVDAAAPAFTGFPSPSGEGLSIEENLEGSPAERGEPGRWHRAVPRGEDGPAALRWEPAESLARKVLRAVGVPTAVGVAAFAIAVIVTVVFVVRGALAESGEVELNETPPAAATPSGETQTAPKGAAGADGEGAAVGGLIVHVVGEVHKPGIVELEAGARVLDAIEAAGGATAEAVLEAVNLARALLDGEQLVIPNTETAAAMQQSGGAAGGGGSASGSAAGGGPASGAQLLSLNGATAENLQQLPGIGPALAERIIEWRTQNGGFQSIDQLTEVSGIGAKTLAKFRDRLTL